MEDLTTYRIRIGMFAGVAAIPAVIKRSRSVLRKLKRRRRPIRDLHVKTFLLFGFMFLLVHFCTSSYPSSVGYSSLSNDITSNIMHATNRTIDGKKFCCRTLMCYNISLSSVYSYQTSVIQLHRVDFFNTHTKHTFFESVALFDSSLPYIPNVYWSIYMDSARSSTITRIMAMDFRNPLVVVDKTHMDSLSLLALFTNLMQIDLTPLSTIVQILHLKFDLQLLITLYIITVVPKCTKTKLTDLNSMTNLNAGTGSCDFLLGNKGIHSYNGNPKRERSPIPGTSSDEVVWGLHNKMVTDLGNLIAPSKDETLNYRWKQFTQHLRRPDLLSAVEIGNLNDMFDVFDNLELKGKVKCGEYLTVKKILSDLKLLQCLGIVTKCEEDMKGQLEDNTKAEKKHKADAPAAKGTLKAKITSTEEPNEIVKLTLTTILQHYNEDLWEIRNSSEPIERKIKLRSELAESQERSLLFVKNMIETLNKNGIESGEMTSGSLYLPLTFHSKDALNKLWGMYLSGDLLCILQEGLVTPFILKVYNLKTFKLKVFISKEEYEECLNHIEDFRIAAKVEDKEEVIHGEETAQKMKRVETEDEEIEDATKNLERLSVHEFEKTLKQSSLREAKGERGDYQEDETYYKKKSISMQEVEELIRKMKEVTTNFKKKAAEKQQDKAKSEYRRGTYIPDIYLAKQHEEDLEQIKFHHLRWDKEYKYYENEIKSIIGQIEYIFLDHELAEMKTCQSYMYKLAEYSEKLAEQDPSLSDCLDRSRFEVVQPVVNWEELNKHCYITKAMEWVRSTISSDQCNVVSVLGFPGSGKTTTLRNAAIYMKNELGFSLYSISHAKEFYEYFDRKERQLFILDDAFRNYSNYYDKKSFALSKILSYSGKNTKILISTDIIKFSSLLQYYRGAELVFNGCHILFCISESTNVILSEAGFTLSEYDMKHILKHNLEANNVKDVDNVIQSVYWDQANDLVPLLWKIFSKNECLRENPNVYLQDPIEAIVNIFKQIKIQNKHQFCGLALCSSLYLNDDYFSSSHKHEIEADIIQLRDDIMASLKVEFSELQQVKKELEALDGVYITRIGKKFQFSHSLFRNIVAFVFNDSSFVCKYASWDFIEDHVRINKTIKGDHQYMLVYESDEDIQRLANRIIQEAKFRSYPGSLIIRHPSIDDDKLFFCLKSQLLDDKDFNQRMRDKLCLDCVDALSSQTSNEDLTLWRGYKFLEMLLQVGADCNAEMKNGEYLIYTVVTSRNCLPVIKFLLEHNFDINKLDKYKRCVLHYALKDIDMTTFLLSLPSLTCLNQLDSWNRTPLWYAVHDKLPYPWSNTGYGKGDNKKPRQEIIDLLRKKGAIMLPMEDGDTST